MTDLGSTLRAWRDRLSPAELGFAAPTRRRTPGLRRVELAALAGVSVEYIERLEQGRATPSEQVCEALAGALNLTEVEKEHLFALAGRVWTSRRMRTEITPGVQRLIEQLAGPVCVYDAIWNRLAWNRSFAVLFGDPTAVTDLEANLLWRYLTDAPSRSVVEHDRPRLSAYVGDLRQALARFPGDARVTRLVAELRRTGEIFDDLWAEHDLSTPFPSTKTIDHPHLGVLQLDCDVLAVEGADLRVVIFTARPGTREAEALASSFDLEVTPLEQGGTRLPY